MRLRATTIGALNLFRTEPGPIGEDDLSTARAFADVATIAILQHQAATDARAINKQLTHALNARISIEQAKGSIAGLVRALLGPHAIAAASVMASTATAAESAPGGDAEVTGIEGGRRAR